MLLLVGAFSIRSFVFQTGVGVALARCGESREKAQDKEYHAGTSSICPLNALNVRKQRNRVSSR